MYHRFLVGEVGLLMPVLLGDDESGTSMKRIVTVLIAMTLALPALAGLIPSAAAANSTCQAYNRCPPITVNTNTTPEPTPTRTDGTTPTRTDATTSRSDTLPFTGIDLTLLVVGGAALLGAGLFVRRISRDS